MQIAALRLLFHKKAKEKFEKMVPCRKRERDARSFYQ